MIVSLQNVFNNVSTQQEITAVEPNPKSSGGLHYPDGLSTRI